MRATSLIGLLLSVAVVLVALTQVDALQVEGIPLSSGAFQALLSQAWFLYLLLAVGVAVGLLAGAIMYVRSNF